MYQTLTIIDNYPELAEHESYANALAFARDVRDGGEECTIMQVLCVLSPDETKRLPEHVVNGVRPGVDFPATLTRGAA